MEENKESKDFELQAKIPGVGELSLKLYQTSWNGLLKFVQQQWPWLMVTLLSGTIGAQIWGRSIPPNLKPPGGEMPAQTK